MNSRATDTKRGVIPPGDIAHVRDKSVYLVMTSEPLCEIAAFNVHFDGVYYSVLYRGLVKSSKLAMNANCHLKLLIGSGSALNHFLAIVFFSDYIF